MSKFKKFFLYLVPTVLILYSIIWFGFSQYIINELKNNCKNIGAYYSDISRFGYPFKIGVNFENLGNKKQSSITGIVSEINLKGSTSISFNIFLDKASVVFPKIIETNNGIEKQKLLNNQIIIDLDLKHNILKFNKNSDLKEILDQINQIKFSANKIEQINTTLNNNVFKIDNLNFNITPNQINKVNTDLNLSFNDLIIPHIFNNHKISNDTHITISYENNFILNAFISKINLHLDDALLKINGFLKFDIKNKRALELTLDNNFLNLESISKLMDQYFDIPNNDLLSSINKNATSVDLDDKNNVVSFLYKLEYKGDNLKLGKMNNAEIFQSITPYLFILMKKIS